MAYLAPNQLEHLKAHQALFDEHQQAEGADIEAYFDEYEDEDGQGSVYRYLCSDLGLEPLPPATSRGFEFFADFRDRYGSRVRVQRSSLATEECVWIFADDNQQGIAEPSPHLTVVQAEAVRDALDAFVKGSDEYKARQAAAHLRGWAPSNLQHHLLFDHDVEGPINYDSPLDGIHRAAHGKEDGE